MKILANPIDAIVTFSKGKKPMPYKFRYEENGELQTVKIDNIVDIQEQKIAGISSLVYLCQSVINNVEKRYELKYVIKECRWELYKM